MHSFLPTPTGKPPSASRDTTSHISRPVFSANGLLALLLLFCCGGILHGQDLGYVYVNAPSGLNIRQEPGLQAPVVEKLAWGRWLRVLDSTGIRMSIMDEGREVTGEWIQVAFPPYWEAQKGEDVVGYAFGPFLTDRIRFIPPHTLYDCYLVMRYQLLPEGTANYLYEIDAGPDKANREFPYDFPPYYDPSAEDAELVQQPYQNQETRNISLEAVIDTINEYVTLELISDDRARALSTRRKSTPYAIDPTPVQRDVSTVDWKNDFLLPIADGTDSIRITDYDGEGYISKRFVGRLHRWGKYVVNEAYEEPSHVLYDIRTGERQPFTLGIPMVSPDGEWVLELFPSFMDHGCQLRLSRFEEESLQLTDCFQVYFSTWVPRDDLDAFFWISDREICIQVTAISQQARLFQGENMDDLSWQWMLITLKR